MDKPTIFFSHSSKDRDLILPIKKKAEDITAGVLDIFMSSDGQSIPFGHNWVHKIEEGLSNAQIMFVFVTSNSINSAWIYFEAGYAYSKGIEVVPIGIGVNIDQLKAPLNLLQGFNIMSGDSLNNIISIINKKFNTQFKEQFSDEDFRLISAFFDESRYYFEIGDIFAYADFDICSQYPDPENKGQIIKYDIDKFFNDYKQYIDSQGIPYSSNNRMILTSGLTISLTGYEIEPKEFNGRLTPEQNHRLKFKISMYNFEKSYALLKELSKISIDIDIEYLFFHFVDSYTCLKSNEDISAIISEHNDVFLYLQDNVGSFSFMNDQKFSFCKNGTQSRQLEYVLKINFDISKVEPKNIIELIGKLTEKQIIFCV